MGDKTVYLWRYFISLGHLSLESKESCRETEKCFISVNHRFLKSEEGVAAIKDRTTYPYIDIWFTEEKPRNEVTEKMGQSLFLCD